MAASGYTLTGITDIDPGGEIDNVVKNKPGVKLNQLSIVNIFLTRESVDILVTVTVGGSIVFPQGPVNVVAAVGTIPSTEDDNIITVIAQPQDEIIIAGTNSNVAAQELRALVKVMPIDDAMLSTAIKLRTNA